MTIFSSREVKFISQDLFGAALREQVIALVLFVLLACCSHYVSLVETVEITSRHDLLQMILGYC